MCAHMSWQWKHFIIIYWYRFSQQYCHSGTKISNIRSGSMCGFICTSYRTENEICKQESNATSVCHLRCSAGDTMFLHIWSPTNDISFLKILFCMREPSSFIYIFVWLLCDKKVTHAQWAYSMEFMVMPQPTSGYVSYTSIKRQTTAMTSSTIHKNANISTQLRIYIRLLCASNCEWNGNECWNHRK